MGSSAILKSVSALIISVSLMMAGYGMFSTFISLRMKLEGFSNTIIGYQTSAFYLGVVIGSLLCSKLINRVGHIRAFSVFCGTSAACVLIFPFFKYVGIWILLRGVLGFCLAGQYIVAESWLNTRTSADNRGTVLAVYMMAINFAFGAGQLMLNFADPLGTEFFMLGAALCALALIPVSLTKSTHPDPVETPHFSFFKLYTVSPVAITGCLCNGLMLGAILGLSPIFIKELGFEISTITFFMTLFMLSGLIFQFPIGKLSDAIDRRLVIAGLCVILFVSTLAFTTIENPNETMLYILAVILGGTSQTLYPLCISHANDYLSPDEMVRASGRLVLSYGIGAAIGPIIAALLMTHLAADGLFYFIATVVFIYLLFILYRMTRRDVPEDKETFVAMPDAVSSPGGLQIDPRYESETIVENENLNEIT